MAVPPKTKRWAFYRHDLGDYMHRWILRTPWGTLRLHHILRSDDDRHLHDHPFDFTSILISGGYREIVEEIHHTAEGSFAGLTELDWPRFSVIRKKAEDAHRLVLTKPIWTLVVSGPKRRDWGFHTEKGWIVHSDYLNHFPEREDFNSHADLKRMRHG